MGNRGKTILGMGAGLVIMLGLLALQQPLPTAARADEQATQIPAQRTSAMDEEIAERFAAAPADVIEIAKVIQSGGVPVAADLAKLGPDILNRSWSQPMPDILPEAGHGLLREAVIDRNIAAATALIAAGADPHFNHDEMAFASMAMKDEPELYWFPDYSRGNALLALWIKSGGDVNKAHSAAYSNGTLIASAPADNLEAILMLLAANADPWLTTVEGTNSDGSDYRSSSFAQSYANANLMTLEVTFRAARLGYYRNGPKDQIEAVTSEYERTAAQYVASSGPENLHIVWAMQKMLPLFLEQTGQKPTGAIAQLLGMKIPAGIGGFFLNKDEIRSPHTPDQLIRDNNQAGTEMWND